MIERIVAAHPGVRTVIFQDDIFSFTRDHRILPLCEGIVSAKRSGRIPASLQFISTNRIDAMTPERIGAMRRAGFRVLGFGIESFSKSVLSEFNKAQIHRHIEPMLATALAAGVTPFLDLILSSPHSALEDVAETLRLAHRWLREGCEIGMYPYVIPFSGAAFAKDPRLQPHTRHAVHHVAGTNISFRQAAKILPIDPVVADVILCVESRFEAMLRDIEARVAHLPSRVRSLLWILCSLPVMAEHGQFIAPEDEVRAELYARLPTLRPQADRVAAANE
jgi:hypothetical protein